MKKKGKPQKQNKPVNRNNDFSSLNNALGSFDLEPPKHYRPDQTVNRYDNNPKKRGTKAQKSTQQKRKEQRKRRKRSKLFYKVVSIIAIVLAIAAVVVTLSLTVFFRIDKIQVVGTEKYKSEQVIEMLPIEKQKNLFLADTKGAESELELRLPYIFNADIRRKLPSTIVVNITETPKVYAIATAENKFILVDSNFKLLEAGVDKAPDKSVVISNAQLDAVVPGKPVTFKDDKTLNDLKAMTQLIDKLSLDEITEISSSDVNTNYMVYDSRITIKLGSTEKLENKVYAALASIDKLNESDPNAEGTITATSDKQIYFTDK